MRADSEFATRIVHWFWVVVILVVLACAAEEALVDRVCHWYAKQKERAAQQPKPWYVEFYEYLNK